MKRFSFLNSLLVIICICACISCAYLFSSLLVTTGLISTNLTTEQQTVFAISMGKSQNKNEIATQASHLQNENGAGFILKVDQHFHLLASVYENKNDAELVKENLKTNGVDSEILCLTIKAKNVEGNFKNEEKTILTSCLKINFDLFKKLYDVAISLDTGVFDLTKAKLECNTIYTDLVAIKTNFETLFKNKKSLDEIQQNLKLCESCLSNLISENYETPSQTFSSMIKFTYCKILLTD